MRVGVVCEGPTDFLAIESFFGHALKNDEIDAQFVRIQPEADNMNSGGGWTNVLLWLNSNSLAYRIKNYFGGGLFEEPLGEPLLDAILIQLDSDILGEPSFANYVSNKYELDIGNPGDAQERADEIRRVIRSAAKFDDMTEHDVELHILAPAVESTEAWCVAAFKTPTPNCELLKGQNLKDEFMSALERSEGRVPSPPYSRMDKDQKRRKEFLAIHAQGFARVRDGCQQFDQAYQQLRELCRVHYG